MNPVSWDGELWFDLALSGAKFKRINGYWSCFRIYPLTITGSGKYNDDARKTIIRHAIKLNINNTENFWLRYWHWFKIRMFDPHMILAKIYNKLIRVKAIP
jgi:hypothetical protein